ncbi:MAG: Shedu immune nuclease family protein [Rhodomicrobium sp.]
MDIEEQKRQFLKILDEDHKEQVYQSFLEKHTRFIPREFVQNHGIGLCLVLRKLSFGADYKTDFFFFSKSTDDWNAVFIEIEKPASRFFKGNTNEFHPDFLNALQQINQWKAWFLSDQNKGTFLSTVSTIQVPRHMAGNPTYNKYVLVFGRRSEYAGNDDRRRLVRASEADDFKIITFDSLVEGLEVKYEVSIASRHNQFIDILTDEITDPALYSWVEPTQLRVSKTLHDKLNNGPRSNHFVLSDGKRVEALTRAAPRVRVRPSDGSATSGA